MGSNLLYYGDNLDVLRSHIAGARSVHHVRAESSQIEVVGI